MATDLGDIMKMSDAKTFLRVALLYPGAGADTNYHLVEKLHHFGLWVPEILGHQFRKF
jgi:hypothetical protein